MVNSNQIENARKAHLTRLSLELRQASLIRCDDAEGWHISRMLREAVTSA
jgi:hypothetical protein